VQTEARLDADKPFRADLLIERGDERVIIELKRRLMRNNYQNVIAQIEHYLLISGIKNGILLYLPDAPSDMDRIETTVRGIDARLIILTPEGSNPSPKQTASRLQPPSVS